MAKCLPGQKHAYEEQSRESVEKGKKWKIVDKCWKCEDEKTRFENK